MKANKLGLTVLAAATAATFIAMDARAASATADDSTPPFSTLNAPVDVDFVIRIPAFLYFQVGTAGATVDLVEFTPSPTEVQNSTAVASANTLNVILRGNNGAITITPTNNSGGAGLTDGAGNSINYSTISAIATGDANLAPPTLSNAGGAASVIPVSSGQVTNRTATWTYTYTPGVGVIPAAGEYGTSARGGRVTYTAAMP